MQNLRIQFFAYLDAIWRRRWYALAIAWVLCAVGWAVVIMMPDRYESEARIYVDTKPLLGPLLKGVTVQNNLNDEVTLVQRTLLSRPNLQQVTRMTDLDLTAETPEDMEALIKRLAENTRIKSQGKNLFLVTYSDTDPAMAQLVVQSLLTIFVENNLGSNREQMESAQKFIANQLLEYKRQLREAEKKLADFRQKNIGKLDLNSDFASQLERARNDYNQAKLAYDDARIKRDQLRLQLQSVPQFLDVQTAPQIVVGAQQQKSDTLVRIEEMRRNLDNLRLRFTEQHPDVIAAKRSLAALMEQYRREQAEAADSGATPGGTAPPKTRIPNNVYEQIKLRLVEAEAEVAALKRRLSLAESELARVEKLALTAPKLQAKLTDLTRDYKIIKKRYEEFLDRREQARVAQAVESQNNNVQFRIVDPPQIPIKPAAPNRPLLMSIVLLVSLGIGGAIPVVMAQLQDTFLTRESLAKTFGLPVLGGVSLVLSGAQRARAVTLNIIFLGLVVGLIGIFGSLVMMLPKISAFAMVLKNSYLPKLTQLLGLT